MVDFCLTQRDRHGQRWVICPICVEEFHPDDLQPAPEGADTPFLDLCKGCFPRADDIVCWDEETGFGYLTHELDENGPWGCPGCRRCSQRINWCTTGYWSYSHYYGVSEWEECGAYAEFCGRPAEGTSCMPVCGECKREIEGNPTRMKQCDIVVFEPYDALTANRFCSEGGGHEDEEWQWGGWAEPPIPAELEGAFTRQGSPRA